VICHGPDRKGVALPVTTGVWAIRLQARDVLPLKRRLEALLNELDAP